MIQAAQHKPIEQKAPARAEVKSTVQTKNASKDLAGSLEANDFASELETSMAADAPSEVTEANITNNSQVKPVKVSAEQTLEMPSALVNPAATGNVDTTSPQVFDPALTKGVENLIQPKTTETPSISNAEVLALGAGAAPVVIDAASEEMSAEALASMVTGEVKTEQKDELSQALLKTPQVAAEGKVQRSPAIDFAQSEIDPQLLNNEDFVAQKNLAAKKMASNPYGMKVAPQQGEKVALENGLKQTQVVKEGATLESASNAPMNSQQFLLNMNIEKSGNQVSDVQAAPKVFDMNNIKTSEPNQIINQISDYIVQAKAAKEPTVNMKVNHQELGMIDITVSKAGAINQDAVAINIGTHSIDGKNFFQQNAKELLSHLSSAGISVSDMKVETPSQSAKSGFDFNSQSGRNQAGADKQFGSEQGQRRHDADRRQDLWKLLNQEAA